ncbi:MAG: transposase, partial [Xenococcaceae cyanobacterium MO_234.B1]|nr:transposase [Xenococcaceae cyanobacterium MO_234.B1]
PRRRQAQGNAHQDRRYGLNCIMEKLSETAETSIAITFLVINLSTLLLQVYCLFMSLFLNLSRIRLFD